MKITACREQAWTQAARRAKSFPMSEKSQALLEAALALDPEGRRWLAEALWDSFDDDEEAIRIATERKAQLERGEARMVPWDEAMRVLGR